MFKPTWEDSSVALGAIVSSWLGRAPLAYVDKTKLIGMHWQFQVPYGGSCDANFTLDNVSFVE